MSVYQSPSEYVKEMTENSDSLICQRCAVFSSVTIPTGFAAASTEDLIALSAGL